ECIYGDYYGTLKSEIDRLLKEGKNILLELDVMGSLTLKRKFPDAKLIFIVPPSIEVLEERLRKRNTETEETLAKRMERAKMELEKAKYFDYEVKNYNLEEAVKEVKKIIEDIISN
ncbi:MAG: guanylate kinase, partial [Ignavibacteria bacterium]|nr:guanylate kinase [Ignavibacteria bacterium]